MILTVNKNELKQTLKAFFGVASKAADPHYTNLVVLRADGEVANIMAGSGGNFALAQLSAAVEREGLVCVPYDLYELTKAATDETLRITVDKTMVVEGLESGFRAKLSLREQTAEYPFDMILGVFDQGVSEYAICRTDKIETLVNLSLKFAPAAMKMPWARFSSSNGEFYGESAPSEYGTLEHYPLSDQTEGDFSVSLAVRNLSTLLTFCGTYTRIGMSIGAKGFVLVDDPEDLSWKGIIGSLV